MWLWPAVVLVVSLVGCTAQKDLEHRSFEGMTQAQIRAELGPPDKEDQLTKQNEHIFGPYEDLWDEMPSGETMTIWTYRASDGWKELYFVGANPEVARDFYWYNDGAKNPKY